VNGEFRDLAITIQQFNLNSKQINIQYSIIIPDYFK